ncbi:magnesium transporter [Chelatococcus daeguensis]|uniref:magnesium transporter n=1 Tax=Chelatococcus daeguensis TaxID=444444 RepID=UPI0007AC1CA1|nr:magnesium transporter [Chelatococcus daeguensis]KZE35935.1 magnesium transporter [Chelatococcus daeguensis]MBM3085250.1 magnesium transporter [Chelatococcus daeguensis]
MVNVEHETAPEALAFRDEEGNVNPTFLASVSEAIADGNAENLRRLAAPLHEADLGALIEALDFDDRPRLVALLGSDFDFAALTEVDDAIREELLESIPNANIAEGVRELDVDDAVYILEDLDEADKAEVLEQLPPPERVALQRSLDYPEDSAGRRMQTEFIAVPPFWTVGQTIDYMRETEDLPDTFYEIFVVDPAYQLIGTVPLDRLLRTKRPVKISDIMNEDQHLIEATDDQEKAARLFQRYNLVSCAVVDEAKRLVGVMMVDDIVDVIEEEADEDLKALGGVKGDEELSDTVWYTVRSRFPWLFANLVTAIVAANVIHLFEGSIQQMVVLAVLMPIVASIGGNAGTQTMTVTVRALATQELRRSNTWRIIRREVAVGICNGVGFAIILGTVAVVWFGIRDLGFVIGLAILTVLSVAALGGILIPLTLNRLGVDPAVSSGPFVTTTTDVIGFFAFLGIATLWFGLS